MIWQPKRVNEIDKCREDFGSGFVGMANPSGNYVYVRDGSHPF